MKELLENIVKSLVDNQDEVRVNEIQGETTIMYEVRVSKSDMGKIIGKEGRIAKAIRTLMKAAAAKNGKKAQVEIVE